MARKPKPPSRQPKPQGKHRYPPFQLRMHPLMRAQLDRLSDKNASDLTEEIRIAIRERLEKVGLWPPKEEGDCTA